MGFIIDNETAVKPSQVFQRAFAIWLIESTKAITDIKNIPHIFGFVQGKTQTFFRLPVA